MRRKTRVKANPSCMDCGKDTRLANEQFEVRDAVWRLANPLLVGILCITCVEQRLGRRLHSADFTPHPINARSSANSALLAECLRRSQPAEEPDELPRAVAFPAPQTPLGRASAALLRHRGTDGRVPLALMVRTIREHRFISIRR